MEWDDYYQRYRCFIVALRQADLVAIVSAKALTQFPQNLPRDWRANIRAACGDLGRRLKRLEEETEPEGLGSTEHHEGDGPDPERSLSINASGDLHSDITLSSLRWVIDSTLQGGEQSHDFAAVAYSQQLVMAFAHISAFIADSVRMICLRRPEILKSDRKLSWKALIEFGTWDAILCHLVEEYTFTFGWDPICEIVQAMRDRLGLKLDIAPGVLARIKDAELLRNLHVHNGGRVSAEYLRRSQRSDVRVGDRMAVDPQCVRQVSEDLVLLGSEILLDVSEVHFGKRREEISGVWQGDRSQQPVQPPIKDGNSP